VPLLPVLAGATAVAVALCTTSLWAFFFVSFLGFAGFFGVVAVVVVFAVVAATGVVVFCELLPQPAAATAASMIVISAARFMNPNSCVC
jgi:CBS domain containing-hemolysin-like protein